MADSTSNLDLLTTSQAQKEVTANELFNSAYPATVYGYRAKTTTGLTWGYYGGRILTTAGTVATINNGTVSLTASATNYVVASRATGAVSASTATTNWNDTRGYLRLYQVVTGASTISSWEDYRATNAGLTDIGLGTGAGGTVTQSTSKTTGVTLNKRTGRITMASSSLAAGAVASFTLTNSTIKAQDVVAVCIAGGATAGAYVVTVDAVNDGSCSISLRNLSGSDLAEPVVLQFVVIAGAIA